MKSPSSTNLPQTASKYQLWPSARGPVGSSSDKLAALSVGRSGTSLSDTAVLPETVPFWQRAGSMSRRRKVSVPELSSTMTTVQEMPVDSRKHTKNHLQLSLLITSKQQYPAGHPSAGLHMRPSAMKGPTVPQAQTGEPAHSAMQ
jgi:hypothetical protein